MMKTRHLRLLLVCIPALLGWHTALSQNKRVTEADVANEQLFVEASIAKMKGKYDEALKLYGDVLRKDKNNHAAAYEIARIAFVRGDDETALSNIQLAANLDKSNTWYQLLLADVYLKIGKQKDAAKIYEALATAYPADEDAQYRWAECLEKAGDNEKAIKVYDRLETSNGLNEDLCRRRHALYLKLNNPKKAAQELEKLIAAYPAHPPYYHLLAGFYEQINDKTQAREVYKRLLKIDPNDARANLALASDQKNTGGDINYLNSLQPLFENKEIAVDAKIKELIPFVQKVADKGDKTLGAAALNLAATLERVHPADAKIYALYGDLLYYTGQPDEALAKYRKALEFNKNVYPVWEQAMAILSERKNYPDLLKLSEDAIELFPNQASAYYYNALAESGRNKHQEAVTQLQQAFLMAGRNVALRIDIQCLLAREYNHLKKHEKAKETLDKALAAGGENAPAVLETYGDTLFLLNDADQAVAYWKKAREKGARSANLERKISDKKLYE